MENKQLTDLEKELISIADRLLNYLDIMNVYEKPFYEQVKGIEKRVKSLKEIE